MAHATMQHLPLFDDDESARTRVLKVAGVVVLHAALIALVLTIRPRLIADLLPKALDVRTIVDELKPPPPKPKPIPPKPVPQAKQMVRQPQPAPPVMTAAPTPDAAPTSFAVAPQPPPTPPAPPAPVAVEAPPAPPAAPPPPVPVTAARFDADYLRNPPPAYPAMSRRLREEGKVLLLVRVSAQGTADSVQVRQSSGHSRLDEAALEAVRHWRFVPAKRGNDPIAASVIVPLVFRLD